MSELEISKKRLDAALLRLETLGRLIATSKASDQTVDARVETLLTENEGLRAQLLDLASENQQIQERLQNMSGQLDAILLKLSQVLEAGHATTED